MKSIFFILVFFMGQSLFAQEAHELIRRISVFPVFADKNLSTASEEAWWQIRGALTNDKRFLVASKNFLMQKDVFQARGRLRPADAIILGQLLDAQALVTTFLEERLLSMQVYGGEYGRLLWEHSIELQPSLPLRDQIAAASRKLILDFISALPYQGFVVSDSLIGRPVYEQGEKTLVKIDVGLNSSVAQGDAVQFIRVSTNQLKPIFLDGANIEVFAEGRVDQVNREVVTVELIRATNVKDISEFTLIRLPKEFKRIQELYAMTSKEVKNINPEFFSPEITPTKLEEKENKPLVAALSFIGNLAAFLLLAF